jgi:multidrug efflux pump subunit AcrA (membrane-fusion protein)
VGLEPGGDALPGMTATVALQVPVQPSLSVPLAAIADPTGTSPQVVTVHGETAHRVAVEVLDLHEGRVAVRGALQTGDEVVVGGHGALADGATVQVLR